MPAIYFGLYAVMVIALSRPPRGTHFGEAEGRLARFRERSAFLCALASTYALPWSGIALIPSTAWFPTALTALLLLPPREGARFAWGGKAVAVVLTGAFLLKMRSFALSIGTPGALWSLEGMSAVFRLESLGPWLYAAQAALFAGLALSFAITGLRRSSSASLFFFSCAGFLTSVFVSPLLARASIALGAEPPLSIAAQIASALFAAALLGRFFSRLSWFSRERGSHRALLAAIAAFSVLFGCWALAAAAG